jgi:hypothetical protein
MRGLQRLELSFADSRNDVQADVAFIGGVGGPSDAGLGDVFEPVRHVFGDGQGRGGDRNATTLLIAQLVEFVESFPLGVAVYADPLSPQARNRPALG